LVVEMKGNGASLDTAIALGIAHGGWIPKNRKTESGRFPSKYQLKELPTDNYPKPAEQNVIDSDWTLIISHGNLTGGSEYTRPWIHFGASKMSIDAAVQVIRVWIRGSEIKVLNVAGPRAGGDPEIYGTTKRLLPVLIKMMSLGNRGKRRSTGMSRLCFPSEVDSSNGKDELKRWKLWRKLGLSCAFGQTKGQLRGILVTLMS
jgi:hypothetical protein